MAIIAAVDQSERTTSVTKEAESLAEAFDDTIHVVHVLSESRFVDLERTNVDENNSAISMDQVREVAKNIARDAATNLDHSFDAVGLVGNPADRIVDYATESEARYIVIGGRKRSPTGKALFGSVSQSIILSAECPVVVTMSKE